jgi:hypoxanthine-DNA glycosylase
MSHVTGFRPVVGPTSRVLILGSMPGRVSPEAGEYYAQPRNVFWRIMGELFGAGPDHPYQERLKLLMANGIALWDVPESCYWPGSLDTAIDVRTAATNDFPRLFGTHPSIERVFFNGGKAEEVYRRRFRCSLVDSWALIVLSPPAGTKIGRAPGSGVMRLAPGATQIPGYKAPPDSAPIGSSPALPTGAPRLESGGNCPQKTHGWTTSASSWGQATPTGTKSRDSVGPRFHLQCAETVTRARSTTRACGRPSGAGHCAAYRT